MKWLDLFSHRRCARGTLFPPWVPAGKGNKGIYQGAERSLVLSLFIIHWLPNILSLLNRAVCFPDLKLYE
jgi:hypothetical protein